jgi:hypothetical protein
MSATPVRIDQAGQPAPARTVADVSALPPVWDEAKVEWLIADVIPWASVNLLG